MRPTNIKTDTESEIEMAQTRDIFFSRKLLNGKSKMASKVANATGTMISCPIQIKKPIAKIQKRTRNNFTRKGCVG